MSRLASARIDRRGATVALRGGYDLLERLKPLVAPFLILHVDAGHTPDPLVPMPDGLWLILAGPEYVPRCDASFELVHIVQPAEPDTRLWISRRRRTIVVDQRPGRWQETMVRRLVHNLVRAQLASAGLLFLHGALCEYQGRGVMLMGGKQAGKTTTLLGLLTAKGTAFCTNDDASLCLEGGQLVGLGWPRSVGIRADARDQLRRQLRLEFVGIDRQHPLTEPQVAPGERKSQARSYFLPREIAEAAGRPLCAATPVSLVVLPRFGDTVSFRELDAGERRACLHEHVHEHPDDKQAPFVKALFPPVDPAAREALAERLCREVRFVELCQPFADLARGRDLILSLLRS